MRSRNWSIRSKIIAMVAVPLTAVVALWVFATAATLGPALDLLSARAAVHALGDPGLRLIAQLQRERHFSAVYVSAKSTPATDLKAQRAATDQSIAEFESAIASVDDMSDDLTQRTAALSEKLDEVMAIRERVDLRDLDALTAIRPYNYAIDAEFDVSSTAAVFFHERVDREVRGLITGYRGQEYLSRADAILAGANASGNIHAIDRGVLIENISTSRYLIASGVADMPIEARGDYSRLITSPAFIELDIKQNLLIGESYAGGPPPISGADWQPLYDEVSTQLRAFELRTVDEVASDATPLAVNVLLWLGLSALIGLVAFVLAIWVSVRVGRSMVGRLIKLRREALELAAERLPTVVRRLQHGEPVDVDVETPPLEYGRDEIGELANAFNDVQRTAVQSAVEEANVRRGINEVFLNIARRSQTLLHRQLSLLDRMERRETEPEELEDLYRVDHLATRMRRHAEDLVILAGAAPGRGWRNPVPVIDVVRGAISEVEDYKRVDIRSVASSALLGRSVGDVIHLLAELIENAASFSPPHTRVQVSGQTLPNGYAIEIEDRGLGMTPEGIQQANRRLAEPPEFDPADSARLGLFVVAQLAHRHHIRVSLRASAYGGVTAVVLIPGDLVTALPESRQAGLGSRSLEAPLVGSGSEEPGRSSLAALQWSGDEQLQEVAAAPARRAIDGRPDAVPHSAADLLGPAHSTVAAELSAEGLVQRRRPQRVPQVPPSPSDVSPADLADALGALGARSVPRNSAPPVPAPAAPPVPAPAASPVPAPAAPQIPAAATAGVPPVTTSSTMDISGADDDTENLPRRVRQANLAPQLRRPVAERESTAPRRTPDQARTLMNALQRGTTRGRVDAAKAGRVEPGRVEAARDADETQQIERIAPVQQVTTTETEKPATGLNVAEASDVLFADAATVVIPVLADLAGTGEGTASGVEVGTSGDRAASPGDSVIRPEKDA
ncbi:nitrate- and nitrite sensing domain-containing protein [Actinoplanes sp. NPDC051851]|uniref:nitrate- and nitrite sensing domain-containing protein n=1 Tax=Actinoplanes sp. NPDC051851 TaxID=3154753 RepID=UPI0034145B93